MAQSQIDRQVPKHSHWWLGVLAFIVLLIVGGSSLLLWRVQSVAVETVHGASMSPLLRNGDGVIVDKTNFIETGDIISYHNPVNPAQILTRRVFAVDIKDAVTTKGDTAAKADAPFSRTLVIGVVQYRVAKLGYYVDFVRSPAALIVGIYLPAAIILWQELRRLLGHYGQTIYHLPGYRIRLS